MNGSEIQRMLTLIDQNIADNKESVRREIFSYLASHKDEAVRQLRSARQVSIPTSAGPLTVSLNDLQEAAA